MNSAGSSRVQRRRLEWRLLSIALLGLVGWLCTASSLDRINYLVQDAGLRLLSRPAHPDIVIVAIDDPSIAAIGRWPWRRALHAELITRVSAQQPRALAMDVLFNDEDLDYPEDDVLLADTMRRSARVVLPVLRRSHGPASDAADVPAPVLAGAFAGLGHVHVAPDRDGVVRSVYLYEGPAGSPWPHISLALACAGAAQPQQCAAALQAHAAAGPPATPSPAAGWTRIGHTPIAYAGGPGHFTTYSYIDVLRGQVPADAFRGKYVLVGAAASGLGDLFATPVGQQPRLMPGVEVVAHALDAQLSGVSVAPAAPWLNMGFNLAPVLGALVALLLAGPFVALLTTGALGAATVLLSLAMPAWLGLQFSPAAALIGLALAYPLWSWRRLSAAAHFLRLEMERLQQEGLPLQPQRYPGDAGDFLEKRINAVEHASRHLRNLHHFASVSLQQLPSPTMVCNREGRILLANIAARRHLGGEAANALQGRCAVELLRDLVHADTGQPLVTRDHFLRPSMAEQNEGRDAQGRRLLVQYTPFTDLGPAGCLLTLVDLTEIRHAQRQRDQAMNFISHDIRAPNASILTLVEMQRAYPGRMPEDELMVRIERYARTSLGMAENFVRLASAQSAEYRMAALDLVAVLGETVDDAWASAQERGVEVAITTAPEAAPVVGDRALLSRALANLVHNAVKFSPRCGIVECAIVQSDHHWIVSVRDQGPGIAPEHQRRLFEPFQRLHERSHPCIDGVGLGLALVHTVVQRHGGTLAVSSEAGSGAEFRVGLHARS